MIHIIYIYILVNIYIYKQKTTPSSHGQIWLKQLYLHFSSGLCEQFQGAGMKYDMKGIGATHTVESAWVAFKGCDTDQPTNKNKRGAVGGGGGTM